MDQKKEKLHEFDLELYDQMMSFAKVMERLCATEYRAVAIDLGLEEPKKHVKKTVTFSEKKSDSVTPLRELPSYPIHYDAIESVKSSNCNVQSSNGQSAASKVERSKDFAKDQEPTGGNQKIPAADMQCSDDNAVEQQMGENNGYESTESVQPAASETLSPEKMEKFKTLSDEEKQLYAEAIYDPDILVDMRSKVVNKGYCYLHQAEIRSLNKVLSVIDST